MNRLKQAASVLASLAFPVSCLSCHREGSHFCEDCLSLLSLNQQVCPTPSSSPLARLYAAVPYEEHRAQLLIHTLKYPPFLKSLAEQCAYLIGAHIALTRPAQNFSNFVIVPVPLHRRRLKWRGFNQAEEIGKELSRLLELPVLSDALERTKNTVPQVELDQKQRRKNTTGTFEIKTPNTIAQRNVLLVDDVATSLGTLEECARMLKRAGAASVVGAVVARD